LINKIKELVQDNKNVTIKSDMETIIYQNSSNYPEDYIKIKQEHNQYIVLEVHRNSQSEKAKTDDEDKAILCAIILYKKMYDDIEDHEATTQIREYLKCKDEDSVIKLISCKIDHTFYAIDNEEFSRISLIKNDDKAEVKFYGKYLVENASLIRGYIVLFDFCKKLSIISLFYKKIPENYKHVLSIDETRQLYVFGVL